MNILFECPLLDIDQFYTFSLTHHSVICDIFFNFSNFYCFPWSCCCCYCCSSPCTTSATDLRERFYLQAFFYITRPNIAWCCCTASAIGLRECFLPLIVFYLSLIVDIFWLNLHLPRNFWNRAILPQRL